MAEKSDEVRRNISNWLVFWEPGLDKTGTL